MKNVTFSAFSVLFSKITDKSSVILSVRRWLFWPKAHKWFSRSLYPCLGLLGRSPPGDLSCFILQYTASGPTTLTVLTRLSLIFTLSWTLSPGIHKYTFILRHYYRRWIVRAGPSLLASWRHEVCWRCCNDHL